MRIKRIRAKNFREALVIVKKELGTDAVILSSEDKRGIKSYVEVTAAIDYDVDTADKENRAGISAPDSRDELQPHQSARMISGQVMELKNEIVTLKDYIKAMNTSGFELTLPEERKNIFLFLRGKSIKEEFAFKIMERAQSVEDIETIMSNDLTIARSSNTASSVIRNVSGNQNRRISMLIGPTGVGKTTTTAKLASLFIKEGKKVAMISIDTYKIGAAEQIRIYSRMIGIPLDIVSNKATFRRSIDRFSDRDVILIDTTGQNPRDDDYIHELKGIYDLGLPIETQLLLSASSDCDFLMDAYTYYKSLPIDFMGFTKTDEAVKFGSIYNLCCLYQKPVAFITTGQRVPGNIEFVDSKKLTNLILRTGSA